MNKFLKKIQSAFIIIIILFPFITIYAQTPMLEDSSSIDSQTDIFRQNAGFTDTGGEATAVEIVATVIQIALGLLGIIFLILIIISGYKWMTAGGNEEQVTKAKANLKNAIIGMVIVLASYGITWFVFKYLPFQGIVGEAIV